LNNKLENLSIHEKTTNECIDASLVSNSFLDDLCMLEAVELFDKKDKIKQEVLANSAKKNDFNTTMVSQDVLQMCDVYEKNVLSSKKPNENKENSRQSFGSSKKKLEYCLGDETLKNILNSSLSTQEKIKTPELKKVIPSNSVLMKSIEKSTNLLNIQIKVAQNENEYERLCNSIKSKQILSIGFVCEKMGPTIDIDSDLFSFNLSKTESKNDFVKFIGAFLCFDNEKQKEIHLMLFKADQIFLAYLKTILERDDIIKILFFSKDHYKFIKNVFNISIKSPCYDPVIAHWLIAQEIITIFQIKQKYCPTLNLLIDNGLRNVKECYGCNVSAKIQTTNMDTIHRGILESLIAVYSFDKIKLQLQLQNLWLYFAKIESEIVFITAEIELFGFGLNGNELDNQKSLLLNRKKEIEEKIFAFNMGNQLNLNSTDDVAFFIYDKLKLKPLAEQNKSSNDKFKHHSTSKEVLKQLSAQHEIPNLIIMWRKLSHTLSKSVYPIERVNIKVL
jgi:hypothetical protein